MKPRFCIPRHNQHGVTLVELVVVITLVGVMGSIGATLVSRIVGGQQDNRGRLMLAQAADGAFARVSGDMANALPNSVRVSSNAAGTWIEWVPVLDAARYRQSPDITGGPAGDILDLGNATDNAFDVIGTALNPAPTAGAQIAWANLGTSESDVYSGNNRRTVVSVNTASGVQTVTFTAAGLLPADAGTARFAVVGTPLTLACVVQGDGTQRLQRYSGYGWKAVQPVSSTDLTGATMVVLLDKMSLCSAAYGSALMNIGLLNLYVGLGDGVTTARMNLMLQLPLDNTP